MNYSFLEEEKDSIVSNDLVKNENNELDEGLKDIFRKVTKSVKDASPISTLRYAFGSDDASVIENEIYKNAKQLNSILQSNEETSKLITDALSNYYHITDKIAKIARICNKIIENREDKQLFAEGVREIAKAINDIEHMGGMHGAKDVSDLTTFYKNAMNDIMNGMGKSQFKKVQSVLASLKDNVKTLLKKNNSLSQRSNGIDNSQDSDSFLDSIESDPSLNYASDDGSNQPQTAPTGTPTSSSNPNNGVQTPNTTNSTTTSSNNPNSGNPNVTAQNGTPTGGGGKQYRATKATLRKKKKTKRASTTTTSTTGTPTGGGNPNNGVQTPNTTNSTTTSSNNPNSGGKKPTVPSGSPTSGSNPNSGGVITPNKSNIINLKPNHGQRDKSGVDPYAQTGQLKAINQDDSENNTGSTSTQTKRVSSDVKDKSTSSTSTQTKRVSNDVQDKNATQTKNISRGTRDSDSENKRKGNEFFKNNGNGEENNKKTIKQGTLNKDDNSNNDVKQPNRNNNAQNNPGKNKTPSNRTPVTKNKKPGDSGKLINYLNEHPMLIVAEDK